MFKKELKMSSNLSNIAILIPAFNPNSNLVDLILALSKFQWKEIVIINDGSSEKSKHYFERLANINQINIINHSRNEGKGSALKTGIKYLSNTNKNLDGLITADSDGQHLLEDILKIAYSSINRENDVIFGVRSFKENTPLRSKFGNNLTKYLIYLFNGISIDDTQTGLRYLPSSIFENLLQLPGKKYEYELECLFAIRSLGYNITQIQIKTVYIDDNSGSHFRPIIDSARIYLVFIKFSFSSLLSFGLDIALFAFFLSVLDSVFDATLIARIISGIFNFTINRNFVFKVVQKNTIWKEIIGYVVLWAFLAVTSGLIVSSSQELTAHLIIPFKILIDMLLFIIAFYIQKTYIFNNKYM